MKSPQLSLLIENPNYPQHLQPALESINKRTLVANARLQTAKGNVLLESIYKNIIADSCKLELMKLQEPIADTVRYGLGGSHFWMSVMNENGGWDRIAIVTFENFVA